MPTRLTTRPNARVVLVFEKEVVRAAIAQWQSPQRPSVEHKRCAAVASCPPLPSRWALDMITRHAKSVGAPIFFVGDLDPGALHAFAAFRAGGRERLMSRRLRPTPVHWLGLDSEWLDWVCAIAKTREVPRRYMIGPNWLNDEYWQVLHRLMPDVRKIIGTGACRLLDRGVRLEMDAFVVRLKQRFVSEFDRRLTRAHIPKGAGHS